VATIDMGGKEGDAVPLSRELGPRLVQCGLGPRSTSVPSGVFIHPSSHLATVYMGQKLVGVGVPFCLGVARSTSKTMSRRPRSTSVPSGILIHAAACVGAGSPSNTKSPGLRQTSILSGIWMHAAVWPQE